MLVVAGDVSGSACARTIFIESFVHGLQDLRIASHSQIIVGAPNRNSFLLAGHMGSGEFLGEAIDVVEVAVGFVFVLLVQLMIVELLIIEFCSILMLRMGWLASRFAMLRILNCVMSACKNLEQPQQLIQPTIFVSEKSILNSPGFIRSAGMKPSLSRVDLARECANGSECGDTT